VERGLKRLKKKTKDCCYWKVENEDEKLLSRDLEEDEEVEEDFLSFIFKFFFLDFYFLIK